MYKTSGACKSYIRLNLRLPGIHCWPNASDEVAFLRNEHRHVFITDIYIGVEHDDRQYEFYLLEKEINKKLREAFEYNQEFSVFYFGGMSCEKIAREVFELVRGLGYDVFRVEVCEDGYSAGGVVEANVQRC